jgi:hypothetical protein
MSEHFERHRHEACDLAGLAARRGFPMSPERAYRAWCNYSDSMAAGWMGFDLEGEGAERTFMLLQDAEVDMRAQDIAFVSTEYQDVARLQERALALGLSLSPEEVARRWADHSATEGGAWSSTRHADLDAVLNPGGAASDPLNPGM